MTRMFTITSSLAIIGLVFTLGLLSDSGPAQGQDAVQDEPVTSKRRLTNHNQWRVAPTADFAHTYLATYGSKTQSEIQRLSQQLGKDKTKDSEIEKKLRTMLSDYFKKDMSRREEELDKIKARVRKMENQLAKRKDSEQEIIDLQIKVLRFRADGLGLFDSGQTGPASFYHSLAR